MKTRSLPDLDELGDIIQSLENYLERLDFLGAGIAAIHVNAAIEQLRSNLDVLNEAMPLGFDATLVSLTPEKSPLN